jgi:hypothetical protein
MKTARGSVLDGRRIRVEWRDFPCLGRESTMAPRAVAVQGRLALGIMGIPAVLAGRTPIMGAQPEAVFAKAIDDALRKAA